MKNKLWLVTPNSDGGYDTYVGMIVCAPDEETARNIHPRAETREQWEENDRGLYAYPSYDDFVKKLWEDEFSGWVTDPKDVEVVCIGIAGDDVKPGVVLSSYNAG